MDSTRLTPPGATASSPPDRAARRHPGGPRILVLGNEKGGSGKSTTAAHLIVALLKRGFSVGSIDLDARQGSLSRLLENRADADKAESGALLVGVNTRYLRSLEFDPV